METRIASLSRPCPRPAPGITDGEGEMIGTRTETEMVAYALEVDPGLLPWIPELLSDFDELGSDAAPIVEILRELDVSASTRVVDLGCGKGAVAVAIAKELGCRVEGIELFEPFIESCRHRAASAGVSDLCSFRHADILKLAGRTEPFDVAVFAALGDVLGPLDDSIGVIRRFVRPGGFMLICDGYIKDGGTSGFPGFESYASRDETLRRLQSHGDALRREMIEPTDHSEAYAREIAQIEKRAEGLAARRPELKADVMRYLENQRREYAHLETNFVSAIWMLERGA